MRRFRNTNLCFTCDPEPSVGVSLTGNFARCSTSESGVVAKTGISITGSVTLSTRGALSGPGVPGNISGSLEAAKITGMNAVQSLKQAAKDADRAAMAAVAQYRTLSMKKASSNENRETAQARLLAARIRADDALRASQAAHISWQTSLSQYNAQMERLRAEQLKTDEAAQAVKRAEEDARAARKAYAKAQQEVEAAARDPALIDYTSDYAVVNNKAEAEELAASSRVVQRRLMIAAKEAENAAGLAADPYKVIAPTRLDCAPGDMCPPCDSSAGMTFHASSPASSPAPAPNMFLQKAAGEQIPGARGCLPTQQSLPVAPSGQAQAMSTLTHSLPSKVDQGTSPQIPMALPPVRGENPVSLSSSIPDPSANANLPVVPLPTALPAGGEASEQQLANQMSNSLAEQLATNPALVNDPSAFAVPQALISGSSTASATSAGQMLPDETSAVMNLPSTDGLGVSVEDAALQPVSAIQAGSHASAARK